MILALARDASGDAAEARRLFELALARDPYDPAIPTGLATWHRKNGRLSDAIRACDKAIALAPGYPDAWIERAVAYAKGGSSAKARASYARALALSPENVAALAGFAALAARDGDLNAAREAAARALRSDPDNLIAASALASVALEQGDADAAHRVLEPVLHRAPEQSDSSLAWNVLGKVYERLGEHDRAFALFERANRVFAEHHAGSARQGLTADQFVEALIAGVAAVDERNWQNSPRDNRAAERPNHLFLLGYPRSGNTLVENILASLPGVAALEERPTLAAADRCFLLGDEAEVVAGVAAFARLGVDELAGLRDAYWSKVAAAGVPLNTTHFLDMDPLKGTRLPFIAKLFPAARVVLLRRDPRDVVWSCFKTAFSPTSGSLEYTSLERAARHYDAVMRLTDLALERLPLTVFEIDYGRLVHEFEGTTKALCAFTDIPWSEQVRSFDRTARSRGVSTASANQVRKGLFDGSGQWRPYARWLEPVLPLLATWIERFGDD